MCLDWSVTVDNYLQYLEASTLIFFFPVLNHYTDATHLQHSLIPFRVLDTPGFSSSTLPNSISSS